MNPAFELPQSPVGDGDPLRCRVPLPLCATFYPIGFPLDITANAPDVLDAAAELWSAYPHLSRSRPMRLEVAVDGAGAIESARSSATEHITRRSWGHLVFFAQPPDNFAVADLSRGFAFASVTQDMAGDRGRWRYHFLEPLVYLMLDSLHATPVHAACIALAGGAVVLCGASGAGKTSLAYACAKRGWTYLADDAMHVLRRGGGRTVAGRPHSIRFRAAARRLFPELNAFPPVLRPNGKCDVEVPPERLGISTAYRAEARGIVFLDRSNEYVRAELRPFSLEMAQQTLEQVLCYGDERTRMRQRSTLRDFLELPVVALRYHDLAEAELALQRLAR
jgi:hypothetical protein